MRLLARPGCAAALCWSIAISNSAFAQTPPAAESVATGRLAGRVLSADGTGPIHKARVRLLGIGGDSAITDEFGRYELTGLLPGTYSIHCEKVGYVTVHRESMETYLGTVNIAAKVDVTPGEMRRDVDIMLARWGVIAVHVTDDLGHPRAGVEVRALAAKGAGGERTLTRAIVAATSSPNFWSAREFVTDDRGDVRIYGLAAGDYVVVADVPGSVLADEIRKEHDLIYPPVYYPGTPSPADARALVVGAGDELSVTLSLEPARAAHVSGQVVRWDGSPGRGFVILSSGGGWLFRSDLVNGRFSFWNLHPGNYLVETSDDPESQERDGKASVPVTVAAEDISNLVLTTVP